MFGRLDFYSWGGDISGWSFSIRSGRGLVSGFLLLIFVLIFCETRCFV